MGGQGIMCEVSSSLKVVLKYKKIKGCSCSKIQKKLKKRKKITKGVVTDWEYQFFFLVLKFMF